MAGGKTVAIRKGATKSGATSSKRAYRVGFAQERSPFSIEMRRRILWEWKHNNRSVTAIAKEAGCHKTQLYKWWAHYDAGNYGPKTLATDKPAIRLSGNDYNKRMEKVEDAVEKTRKKRERKLGKAKVKRVEVRLYDYAKDILGFDALTPQTHTSICEDIQGLLEEQRYNRANGITRQITALFLWPRGSLKTTIGAISAIPYTWSEIDPNYRWLLDSENQSLSKSTQFAIRQQLESNPTFHKKYGDWLPESNKSAQRWTAYEMDIRPRKDYTKKEPSLSCAGIDVVKTGHHYDGIIFDDLQSEKNSKSSEQIEKVIEHYRLAMSLLEPDGIAIMFGTRWCDGDLYGHIIENEAKHWQIDVKSAVNERGELFFPSRLSADFLSAVKDRQGPHIFAAQYMNDPVSAETADFLVEWMDFYKQEKCPPFSDMNLFMSIDPAISTKKTADYTVCQVWGWDEHGGLWLLDGFRDRIRPDRIVNRSLDMAERWNQFGLWQIGIETIAFQQMLKNEFQRVMNLRMQARRGGGVRFNMEELKPRLRNKRERIRRLQPLACNNLLHVPEKLMFQSEEKNETMDFIPMFMREFERYPRSSTDDLLDCAAYQMDFGYPPTNGVTAGEKMRRTMDPEYAEFIHLTAESSPYGDGWSSNWYTM